MLLLQDIRYVMGNAVGSCAPSVELITISIVTKGRIWHEPFRRFFTFWKFPPQICECYGATYGRICGMFSALQSTSGPLTVGDNSVQIDA